ncbi:MAG: TonB-dependent siderophore receptor [Proteobacteria bacterium]|nr:TonB-dependent siderophore receptor [Pseudomonadota bacterium]
MNRTPLAASLVALFAAPSSWGQAAAPAPVAAQPPAGAAAPAQPAGDVEVAQSQTLPQVNIEGSAARDNYAAPAASLGKLGPDLRDLPQSAVVINKALLQSQGATSLSDALRNVPGITLGGAEGGQIGNNINLNGFTARTDIYLDGFRDRGQYYRDTFALDAVEVLMGPSSMLFGRGSTGGVINQVMKKPSLKEQTEVMASVTTNGMVRTTVDHGQAISDTAAWRIAAMAQDGAPTTRDVMKNRDYGLAPSLKLGIGTPTEITLSALLQHNRDMPDYGVPPLNGHPAAVDRNTFYGYTDDRLIQDVGAVSATIEHRYSPTLGIRNQTQYNDVRVNARETAPQGIGTVGTGGYTPLSPAGIGSQPLEDLSVRLQSHDRVIHDKSLFNQTELTAKIDGGGVRHNLLLGGEIGHDTYRNQAYYRNGNCNGVPLNPSTGTSGYSSCEPLLDPDYVSSPADAPSRPGNLATSSASSLGVYVNDIAEIGSRFKLVGGLRHDRFQAYVNNTITKPLRVDQTVNFTSVRLGGIWQPDTAQSYYASYSTSFNPSLEQLTNTTGTTAPLPPEKSRAYELGGKWNLQGDALIANAAAFQITKYNARSQNSDGTYTATGTVRVNGARLGASGAIDKRWKVFGGYTWLAAEIVDAIAAGTQGMTPQNAPRGSATLWSTYEFMPHWEVGGGMLYQSSRYVNNTDTVQVGGYARWDATLAYRQRAYDIRLNLFNLTNKYYADALIQSDGGRSVPGTGRSAMLTFSYRI